MTGTRRKYPETMRQALIARGRTGESPESLARQFAPSAQTIRNWLRQADADTGKDSRELNSAERAELVSLRRELERLREEYEILKKIRAWFAPSGGVRWAKPSNL